MTSPAAGLAQRTTRFSHLARSVWLFGPLAGIAVGLPILGIGGRIAMRAIAHATGVAPGFSLSGTLTVVLMGAVSGAAGGLILAVLHRVVPNREGWRMLLFGVILVLLTLRGLSPATQLSLTLFLPLTLLYGAVITYVYRHRLRRSARSASTSSDE